MIEEKEAFNTQQAEKIKENRKILKVEMENRRKEEEEKKRLEEEEKKR